jgi:hypothetical protein
VNCRECEAGASSHSEAAVARCVLCGSGVCLDHLHLGPRSAQADSRGRHRRALSCSNCAGELAPARQPSRSASLRQSSAAGRLWRRVSLTYHLLCAREDARVRNLTTPSGIWACYHCPHVSLDHLNFSRHLVGVH